MEGLASQSMGLGEGKDRQTKTEGTVWSSKKGRKRSSHLDTLVLTNVASSPPSCRHAFMHSQNLREPASMMCFS